MTTSLNKSLQMDPHIISSRSPCYRVQQQIPSTRTWQAEWCIAGLLQGAKMSSCRLAEVLETHAATSGKACSRCHCLGKPAVSPTTSGFSAMSAATSGDIIVGAACLVYGVWSVVVYAAQIHYKVIPIVGSTTDRGISWGTERFETAGLGIPAARGTPVLDPPCWIPKSNQIKSLLLSHHHSTCAGEWNSWECAPGQCRKQFTYRQYILTDLYRR